MEKINSRYTALSLLQKKNVLLFIEGFGDINLKQFK